jgi:hypothetical protein
LAFAKLVLELLELTQQSIAETLLLGRELGGDPLALRPAPGLEPLGFLAAAAFELGMQPDLGRLIPASRLDELHRERAVQTLGEVPRLFGRPQAVRLLAPASHCLALEAYFFGHAPLGFGALKLQALHELGSARAHLDLEAVECLHPTPGELGRKGPGGRVDDLGGRLFGDRVRQGLGIQILGGRHARRLGRCVRHTAFFIPDELAARRHRIRPAPNKRRARKRSR